MQLFLNRKRLRIKGAHFSVNTPLANQQKRVDTWLSAIATPKYHFWGFKKCNKVT